MPLIHFFPFRGVPVDVDIPVGVSVMQGAVSAGVPGIVGECGGNAMCATCHVYIDERDILRLPEMRPSEVDMLDCTASERLPNSRLSCQLKVTSALDNLTVHLPERQ
ncbi:rhodocoxin [Paraburkholderia fungorum]|uniref:Rhodocoxin n=1 Tax=Paraburkholderia fungorum TaxID=134537 RepID=A0AAU8SYB2_9BURK|nr:2Fe-2S iron-sulfur cluster-binding protein [Paraburkholderia fungorum]AJZ59071.1 rhodocoxin [Paraburkholderia fungorum]